MATLLNNEDNITIHQINFSFSRIYSGGSVAEENPHGKLTHFNFWSRELATDEMISFTQNCHNSLNKDGDIP